VKDRSPGTSVYFGEKIATLNHGTKHVATNANKNGYSSPIPKASLTEMRVFVVGPVSPFRSGIARHTTALCRDLAHRPGLDLSVISFERQYPAILYHGESDVDVDAAPPEGIKVVFCLDSINPFTWRAAVRRIFLAEPDLVIIPAWTFFVAPCLGWIARSLKRRGIPVAMIVHNAEDHEASLSKRTLSKFQLGQASWFVTHNEVIAARLKRLCSDIPIRVCPHPTYDEYPAPTGRLERGASFELLFFGLVRPYKGLDIALRALAAADLPDLRFSIVGEFWDGRRETEALIRKLKLGGRVEMVPRFVSDQEAAEYFHRCDAVIAPYRSATGSGVIALAQWYSRPVIASDIPGLAEAIDDGVTGWLFPSGDVAALAQLLRTKVSRAAAAAMQPAISQASSERTWARLGDAILCR